MGKRKGGDELETLISHKKGEEEEDERGGGGFFGCYLLTSLSPRHKGHTYIGFTVNPKRRIRQHNGEIRSGAQRTKSKRPWEMALCIYGFPTNVAALQFEWAWQHPIESLVVRKAAVAFKSLSGIANKIKLAYTMLTLPTWQSLSLTVNFFSTQYKKHCAGCPSLPEHMNVQVCSMDELPCYTVSDQNVYQNEELDIEECEGIANGTGYNNLAEHEYRECVEAGGDCREVMETFEYETFHSSAYCRNRIEERTPEFSPNMEESGFKQPRRDTERYDHTQPSFPIKSPSAVVAETFERGIVPLSEACSVELDCSSRKDLQTRAAKPLIKSSTVLCDVEVIDVFTPEPSYGISLQPKKRRIDYSEIIDLTKSPIFLLS